MLGTGACHWQGVSSNRLCENTHAQRNLRLVLGSVSRNGFDPHCPVANPIGRIGGETQVGVSTSNPPVADAMGNYSDCPVRVCNDGTHIEAELICYNFLPVPTSAVHCFTYYTSDMRIATLYALCITVLTIGFQMVESSPLPGERHARDTTTDSPLTSQIQT